MNIYAMALWNANNFVLFGVFWHFSGAGLVHYAYAKGAFAAG
jgi:hypothetical protein